MSQTPETNAGQAGSTINTDILRNIEKAVDAFGALRARPEHERSPLFPFQEQIAKLRITYKASYKEITELLTKAGLKDITEQHVAAFCRSAGLKPRTKPSSKRTRK